MDVQRSIDHIVYAVNDLNLACDTLEEHLGIRPIFGGYHKTQGTKNALVNLSDKCYLEVLAPDHSNTEVAVPRWMGIDVLSNDQLTRWAIKSDLLQQDSKILSQYSDSMGIVQPGSRNTESGLLLQWQLIQPLPFPEVEVVPFMLDWGKDAAHPCDMLPDMGCKLLSLSASHPKPESFDHLFEKLGLSLKVYESSKVKLNATIECPNGMVTL